MSNHVIDRIKELTDLALGWDPDETISPISDPQALSSPETGNSGNKVPETRRKLPRKAFPLAPKNWEQTGTLVGTAAAQPAQEVAGASEPPAALTFHGDLPPDWVAGVARLRIDRPPLRIPPAQWQSLLAGIKGFMGDWAGQAHALQWTTVDLFGCHPVKPEARHDYKGAVWFLRDREIVAFTESVVTFRTRSGSIQTFRKHVGELPGRVLIWEM